MAEQKELVKAPRTRTSERDQRPSKRAQRKERARPEDGGLAGAAKKWEAFCSEDAEGDQQRARGLGQIRVIREANLPLAARL